MGERATGEMGPSQEDRWRELLAEGLEASGRLLNPLHQGALTGDYIDPSARRAANASVECRTLESVVAMHTIEGLLNLLTPRDLLMLADAALAVLCIPALVATSDGDESMLAALQEGASGSEVVAFFEKHGDELRRALEHIQGVVRSEGV